MQAPTRVYLLAHAGLVAGAVVLALWPWVAAAEPVSGAPPDRVLTLAAAVPGGCGTPLDPTHNFVDGRGPEPRIASVMDAWLETPAPFQPQSLVQAVDASSELEPADRAASHD